MEIKIKEKYTEPKKFRIGKLLITLVSIMLLMMTFAAAENLPDDPAEIYLEVEDINSVSRNTCEPYAVIASFDLDDYVNAPNVLWSITGNNKFTIERSGSSVTIVAPEAYNEITETLTFTATYNSQTDSDSATFTVTCDHEEVDESPYFFRTIPDQIIYRGEYFESFDLDDYARDADTPREDLHFTVSGSNRLIIDIDSYSHRVTFDYRETRIGPYAEKVTFRVEDEDGNYDTQVVWFKVLDEYYDHDSYDDRYGHWPDYYDYRYDYQYNYRGYYSPYYPYHTFNRNIIDSMDFGCQVRQGGNGWNRFVLLDDMDCDGIPDTTDNCVMIPNVAQSDWDENGLGDDCDMLLQFTEVTPNRVDAGNTIVVKTELANFRPFGMRQIKIKSKIRELGIEQTQYIDLMENAEQEYAEILLTIPGCADLKDYEVETEISYDNHELIRARDTVTVKRAGKCFNADGELRTIDSYGNVKFVAWNNLEIDFVEIEDIVIGSTAGALYPITLSNNKDHDVKVTFDVLGHEEWGFEKFTKGKVMIIPTQEQRTLNLYVYAYDYANAGDEEFAVDIASEGDATQIVLTAHLQENEPDEAYQFVLGLQNALWLIFAIFLAVILLVLYRKSQPLKAPILPSRKQAKLHPWVKTWK